MRLADVLEGEVDLGDRGDIEVASVEIDSRLCGPGSLFFALPGAVTEGSRYAAEAVARGAVAVLSTAPLDVGAPNWRLDESDLRRLLPVACASITGHPERSLTLVGVTGTNGKTTVTTLLVGLFQALGRPATAIGTLTHERTTPASPELYRELAVARDAADGGRALVALEVSSHALTQGRVDGLVFEVAAFTNLSVDHLDYHGTMEEYFTAKARLFEPSRCRRAVIWVDDEHGRRLAESAEVPVTRVTRSDARDVHLAIGETRFVWRGRTVRTALSGQYNLDNVLLVLAAAVELGVDGAEAAEAAASLTPVPGRFEVVGDSPKVIVDYAHTPDGLERLLADVRQLCGGRVVVVFGCGGDRDRSKRPMMGEVATRLADHVVVTSDNPRSEDPEAIMDEVLAGCVPGALVDREPDRRRAIARALDAAGPLDAVVIAGKGHETHQILGTSVIDFDDRAVARELLGGVAC